MNQRNERKGEGQMDGNIMDSSSLQSSVSNKRSRMNKKKKKKKRMRNQFAYYRVKFQLQSLFISD